MRGVLLPDRETKAPATRITGSFARLTPTDTSDIDIRLAPVDLHILKAYLDSKQMPWGSTVPGHIHVDGFEFFTAFHRIPKRDRAEYVTINGKRFKTW